MNGSGLGFRQILRHSGCVVRDCVWNYGLSDLWSRLSTALIRMSHGASSPFREPRRTSSGAGPPASWNSWCLSLTFFAFVSMAVAHTQRATQVSTASGIQIVGVQTFKSFSLEARPATVWEAACLVTERERRFLRASKTPTGGLVYVRANIWTWGEVIEIRLSNERRRH